MDENHNQPNKHQPDSKQPVNDDLHAEQPHHMHDVKEDKTNQQQTNPEINGGHSNENKTNSVNQQPWQSTWHPSSHIPPQNGGGASHQGQVPPASGKNETDRQPGQSVPTPPPSWGQQPYTPNQPYGNGGQPYWNQNPNGAPPPNSNWGYGWQQGGFQPSPQWPPEAPKKKANTGVKIFLIILAVLFGLCIIGFGVFGAVVVSQQNNHEVDGGGGSSSSSSQSSSKNTTNKNTAIDVPDKTNPNFSGLNIQSETGDILTPEQVYEKAAVSMVSVLASSADVTESTSVSQGSGIIATSDGYIITNAHVINYSKNVTVAIVTSDQKHYDGVVVGFDKDADLAVIKIDAKDLPAATFGDSKDLSVGETVIAIGNPGGLRYSGSMTMGIVSSVNRSVENFSATGVTYIQTDTAINPGNSGGGLINMRGQVVGINTIKVVSNGYEGMGFSIPVSQVKDIIDTLIKEGSIPAVGRLGLTGGTQYLPVSNESYSVASGVVVATIDDASPLKSVDLRKNDLIVGFNGTPINTMEDIYAQLKNYRVGQEVTLTIRRITDDKDTTFDIKTTIMQRETKETSSSTKS